MATAAVLVPLPQMIDLALGSPELGAVNFNILHSLLHVLVQQVDLLETSVEFHGDDCNRVQSLISTVQPGPSVNLTEYKVTPSGKKFVKGRPKGKRSTVDEKEIDTAELKKSGSKSSVTSKGSQKSLSTVVIIESADDKPKLPRMTVTVSQERFFRLEKDIDNCKDKIHEILEMPTNAALVDAIRGGESKEKTPVSDMWQALNLAKRMAAAEEGVEKLASMVEDFIRDLGVTVESGDGGGQEGGGSPQGSVRRPSSTLNASRSGLFGDIIKRIEDLEAKFSGRVSAGDADSDAESEEDEKSKKSSGSREELSNLKNTLKTLEADMKKIKEAFGGKDLTEAILELESLLGKKPPAEDGASQADDTGEEGSRARTGGGDLEERLNGLEDSFNGQLTALQNQLLEMEKELGGMLEKINVGGRGGSVVGEGGNVGIGEMFDTVQKLQLDFNELNNMTLKMTQDVDKKQGDMDALIEEIELLKTAKADREDLEDALADKADAFHMNRKVSHDQFDAACDDLTKGIEDAFQKLTQQEALWNTALEEIQQNIGNKLDKMEFDPLRDFVNTKIARLQERLKAIIALKKEQEAAGSKSRFLRNVNCISCDKDVIMKKLNEFATIPMSDAMPANRSMRPYLSYELDQVRKQKKCLPHGRNMHHLESALNEEKTLRRTTPGVKQQATGDHLCNRYCGGSHTVTTPHQRVTRVGHFLTQWGPEAIPLVEGQIMGKDGQMYRAQEIDPNQPASGRKVSASMQTDARKSSLKQIPGGEEDVSTKTGETKKSEGKSDAKSEGKPESAKGSKGSLKNTAAKENTPPDDAASTGRSGSKASGKGSVSSKTSATARTEATE